MSAVPQRVCSLTAVVFADCMWASEQFSRRPFLWCHLLSSLYNRCSQLNIIKCFCYIVDTINIQYFNESGGFCLSAQCWAYRQATTPTWHAFPWVLGVWTPVVRLEWQVHHSLSHLPRCYLTISWLDVFSVVHISEIFWCSWLTVVFLQNQYLQKVNYLYWSWKI